MTHRITQILFSILREYFTVGLCYHRINLPGVLKRMSGLMLQLLTEGVQLQKYDNTVLEMSLVRAFTGIIVFVDIFVACILVDTSG